MNKKETFLKGFDNPNNTRLMVQVTVPDCPEPEMIINPKENFDGKKAYYEKAYNENLELNTFNKIKILDYQFD